MTIRAIDFHGFTLEQVKLSLEEKLDQAIQDGEGIVRIIHGQGKHSDYFPVIKSYVRHWLEESEFAQSKIETFFRGEEGTPYTSRNAGETLVLLKVPSLGNASEISWEDEEKHEAVRNSKRLRADKNKTKHRQRR